MNVTNYNKSINCTVFEDNNRVLKITKIQKIRLRTKYIAIKYYYFRMYIENGDILLEKIDTTE